MAEIPRWRTTEGGEHRKHSQPCRGTGSNLPEVSPLQTCIANDLYFMQDHTISFPVVVMVNFPCLTPRIPISWSAIFLISPARPLTTSTSRQLCSSNWTCIPDLIS